MSGTEARMADIQLLTIVGTATTTSSTRMVADGSKLTAALHFTTC